MATEPLIGRYVYTGVSSSMVYKRLRRLVRAGLLECHTHGVPRGMHALYVPTPDGYRWVGSDLAPTHDFSLATIRHTLAVAEVGFALLGEGYEIWTERELHRLLARHKAARKRGESTGGPLIPRAGESPRDPDPWVRVRRSHVASGDHPADLLVLQRNANGAITYFAYEIEATCKADSALRAILQGYRAARQLFPVVTYYATSDDVERQLKRVAADLAFDPTRLRIERLYPTHSVPHSPVRESATRPC